jgi:hypothetical protein
VLPAALQVPAAAVRTEPRAAVPVTGGTAELAGASLTTAPSSLEAVAVLAPIAFLAVTSARSVAATSVEVTV